MVDRAALINKTAGVDVELVEGNRSEFTIWVGPRRVDKPSEALVNK